MQQKETIRIANNSIYNGDPGARQSVAKSFKPPKPKPVPNHCDKEAGNNKNVLAKIAGITPDIFNLSGKKLAGA